jgi:hypothetical protein
MPVAISKIVERFVAEHHVEQSFFKRQRDRSTPRSPAHRAGGSEDDG